MLAEHSAEHVVLVLRTITESEGNARALIEPVIKAVSAVAIAHPEWTGTGLRWIEAFDGLALLELYGAAKRLKKSAAAAGWSYLAGMLVLVLRDAFADQAPQKSTQMEIRQARAEREQAARERKAAARERANGDKIAFGRELIAARAAGRRIDMRIGGQPSNFLNVARTYGDRPSIWRAASWEVLVRLSSPTMSRARRAEIERQIESGQCVSASVLRAAVPGAGRSAVSNPTL
ncbi:hypothetical protein D4Q52_19825 [Rhodopseudomonas palustris]|uniref:Uncharacterized protein n=1 Tax=Rhodopseudomonas palustris TaxID=1076 RepID=A0A418V181_RHOPL|nr:hypothetical protein D4Q52_19825 [Rhodopseudomonas palustris]